MKIQDIIYEDVGQAISQAVVGAADAVLDIFDMQKNTIYAYALI